MAYSESPFSSTSSSYRRRWNYDVFLSFRGEDTRKTITDHLYSALIQVGIHTFRDDNELPRGEEISRQLLRAIEGSRISIVIFSRNYASSRWCLDELVKIIECRQKIQQVVLPIFYNTDPSEVRKQTGSYAKAFDEHEEHFKEEMKKVNRWREALAQAANLPGWGLNNETKGYAAEFIKRVVTDVACKLGNKTLHVAKHPVGISSRVQDVISLLKGERNNVGIVGIHGIAGIGKTTIAKAVFNNLYFGFEGSCFLSGVKEISDKPNGLVELQERLLHDILKPNIWKISNVFEGMNLIKERLHRKKVLVVLDDVDKREQLEALMGERCWFGDGSKIIVVTKNEHLLTEVEVDGMYHAKELVREQSLQLFSLHAFRENRPAKDYEELSEKVVDYCKGLPLALKMLGSHLSTRDKAGWEIDIAFWQNIPHEDIQGKIIECRQKIQQVVLPIFYNTDSSDVRKQTGSYAKAFDEHEKHIKEEMEKVNRYEAELIETIVNDVASKLEKKTRIEMTRPKSGWTDVISASEQEQSNVDMAQQREPLLTGEFERANDLTGAGIELPPDTSDDQEPLFLALDSVHHVDRIVPPTIDENYIQVLGQSNVELDNFSVGAERTQAEEEEDTLNNSGRVAQPGAGASSSGGLRHNPSETRGAPCSTQLVGRAFEENRNVIWSWLTDDEVSIIGIYGMAGAGKTTLLKHIRNELLRSPDIYYPVYWVTLSPDFSIHKLQNKIAKCIQLSFSNEEKELLGLRAEKLSQKLMKKQRCWKEEELGRRAKELSQELMKKQRWILILDNLCNSFELNKVGIPVPFKRCKLIMTTRSEEVCLQMNSKYNVRVNPLPREESWTLWYLQGTFLCCQGQGRTRIEMARLKSGWTLLLTNLILELASAVFDQLGYALVGMVLALVALLLSTAELIHMARKERMRLLPIFLRPSTRTLAPGKPVGTIVEYFGWVGAVWQCFYSTVAYAYARQKKDNPIKMCLLPSIFLSCVVISIVIKKSYIDKRA